MLRTASRATPGAPRAVWALSGLVAGAAAAAWFGGADRIRVAGPATLDLPLFALVVFLANALQVNFEYRQEAHTLTFGETTLVVGIICCRPGVFMLGGLVGYALALGLVWRRPPMKLCFNLAVRAAESTVALLVFGGLVGQSSVLVPRAWVAALVAVLAAEILSFVAVITVIRLAAGPIERAAVVAVAVLSLAVASTDTALGLVIVLVLAVAPWGLLLLAGIGAILGVVYRQYAIMRQRYANLGLLYAFSGALSAASPGDDVLRRILEESLRLLRAERAELTLPAGAGWVEVGLDEQGLERGYPPALARIAEAVLGADSGVCVPAAGHHPLRDELAHRGIRDALGVPLVADEGRRGALVVFNRQGDVRSFDGEDLALFQALANHASVALRNAQLLDRLTEEVSHRAYQAMHDSLTGLGNRELFAERVKAALGETASGRVVAVMLMDLDEFKEVNDTLGHHTGDTVLREIAGRLSKAVGARGTVARLGGDEFAIAIPDCRDADEAFLVAMEIRATVEQPLSVEDLMLGLHASIGVSLSPAHGSEPAVLLQRADVAMYSAKGGRRGVELYSPDRDHYSQRRLALSGELRQAIAAGDLSLYFQPKASLIDGTISGVEALVRWHHPRHGFVPPDEFIPVAEQSGLIAPLTRWVLGQALRQLALWRRSGLDLTVAVNLSARSLLDAGLVDDIARALSHAQVPASALLLELTESTVMADPDRSQIVLQQLFDLGCRLAIDDFGTGYSSLSRLKQLPVDEIKIDKSFVLHMATDTEDAAIVRSIIDLSRSLGLRVVAEGVEDELTSERLRALGCDSIQGFHLCRPQPAADVGHWLESQAVRRLPTLGLAPTLGLQPALTR